MIRRLHHSAIDKKKWDALVQNSPCADVYALSTFLDAVCPDWNGLILNNYEAVMPLPVKKKCFVTYLVQPIFSQRYAVYSQRTLTEQELDLFRTEIRTFIRARINLLQPLFNTEKRRTNFVLDLSKSYEEISSGYSENARRNCKKALEIALECRQTNDVESALRFFFEADEQNIYTPYENQIRTLVNNCTSEIYEVCQGTEKYAVAIFLKTNTRLYYLFPASSAVGKQYSSMFLLVDTVIRNYAGTAMLLDFEGSEIDGIQRFYKGFGVVAEPYYFFDKRLNPQALFYKCFPSLLKRKSL